MNRKERKIVKSFKDFMQLQSYTEAMEEQLHEVIDYARYQEETKGTGKQTLDDIFSDNPERAKSFYPLIENTKAEYVLNIS